MRPIDIFEMTRTGATVERTLASAQLERLAPLLAGDGGEIAFTLSGGIDEQGRPAALLQMRVHLALRCDLCGRELPFESDHRQRFFFVRTERELNALPIDAGEEDALLGSESFDVQALVEDEAILTLPISPRHEACAAARSPQAAVGDGGTDPDRRRPFAVLAGVRGKPS